MAARESHKAYIDTDDKLAQELRKQGKVAVAGAIRGRMAAIGLTAALLILIIVFVTVYFTR